MITNARIDDELRPAGWTVTVLRVLAIQALAAEGQAFAAVVVRRARRGRDRESTS